ncbi:MAG: mechanosensitive ion channel [bacterium]|jgi:MscS family membrane protein
MDFNFNELPTSYYQIALSIIAILFFFAGRAIVKKIVKTRASKINLEKHRIGFTLKFFNVLMFFALLMIIAIIWDVSFKGLSIYFASLFAVIGVAFFAQWSLLSNITAAIILFFNYSYKIGHSIKVLDGDSTVTGKIIDIQLFYFYIKTEEKEVVSYPNNLILQKPIVLISSKSDNPNTKKED